MGHCHFQSLIGEFGGLCCTNSLLTRAEYIANLKHRFASTKFQEEKVAASITRRYSFAQECVGFFMSKCDDRFSSHRCLPLFQFNPD